MNARNRLLRLGLTDIEIDRAVATYRSNPSTFHNWLREHLIVPNMDRINAAVGQKNDPAYITYLVEYIISQIK